MRVLVTGAAGFIGAHVSTALLEAGHEVVGFDNLDQSYPLEFKQSRLARLSDNDRFSFLRGDIRQPSEVEAAFATAPDTVVHLAAEGGLRRSLDDPAAFVSSNISGFANVIGAAVHSSAKAFVYASSGAVYGGTCTLPFREDDAAAFPLSLYATTKRCDELLAFTYAHIYGLRCTGFRFFTVYGPDGRPDMAVYGFARQIREGRPIRVHGHGKMVRDFVYVEDIATAVRLAVEDDQPFGATIVGAGPSAPVAVAPWRVLNVATGHPVTLLEMIRVVEDAVGKQATLEFTEALAVEVQESSADLSALRAALGFVPPTTVYEGIPRAVSWYLDYLDGTSEQS